MNKAFDLRDLERQARNGAQLFEMTQLHAKLTCKKPSELEDAILAHAEIHYALKALDVFAAR